MRLPAVVALIALVGAAGACAARGADGDSPLVSTLHVESFGDSVRFSLQVTNASPRPLRLTFPSAQLFEFVVSQHEREVWRWSDDRSFAQVLHSLTLEPGETRAFDAVWHPPAGRRGELTVRAHLTSQPPRAEQQTRFHLH